MDETIDFYELLGVSEMATTDEIQAAYRKLVKIAHPDAGGSAHLFRLMTAAYEVLADPARRATYDHDRHGLSDVGQHSQSTRATTPPWPVVAPTPRKRWDDRDESLLSAISLGAAIESGWCPPAAPSNLLLQPGEAMLWPDVPCSVDVFCSMDAEYWVRETPWSLSVRGLASKAHTAAKNARERDRAARIAAPQWRNIGHGRVSLSTLRLVLHTDRVLDCWYGGLTSEEFSGDGFVLYYSGEDPIKVRTPYPEWSYVAMKYAAWRQVQRFPMPADLLARAKKRGRPVEPHVAAMADHAGVSL